MDVNLKRLYSINIIKSKIKSESLGMTFYLYGEKIVILCLVLFYEVICLYGSRNVKMNNTEL